MNFEIWIAAISGAVAVVSVFTNFWLVRRQTLMQAEQVAAAVDSEKARWLEQVLQAFGDASALIQSRVGVYTDQEFTRRRLDVAGRLSALTDIGRLFFPNVVPESRGAHKMPAYRGKRRPVLDAVLLGYDVVNALDRTGEIPNDPLLSIMFDLRRVIVSEVQHSTDPRRRDTLLTQARRMRSDKSAVSNDEIAKLIRRVGALPGAKLSFEDTAPAHAPR